MAKFSYIITALLAAAALAYAAEGQAVKDRPFIYDSSDLNDPFMPLVAKDGRLKTGYGVIKSINDVVLEGIVYDPLGESVALISGFVVKESDQIGKITVKKIGKDTVVLISNNKEYTFKLKGAGQ